MAPGTLGNAIVQVALSKHYKGAKGLMNIALLPEKYLPLYAPTKKMDYTYGPMLLLAKDITIPLFIYGVYFYVWNLRYVYLKIT